MLDRPIASARQVLTVGADLLLRRYPSPLYRRPAPAGELPPTFCLHSAAPEPFAATLGFLAANGYRTLLSEELLDLMGRGGSGERAVLLTFDDGVREVWSIVHPLLKRHGMRATCFVVPGRIEDAPAVRPTLEDVWQGRAALAEVVPRPPGDPPLATWPEIRAMAAGGVIDIQCHSLDHRLVFTSPRIVGFVSPQALAAFHPFEFAMFGPRRPPLGSPIYTSAPRLGECRAFRPDPDLAAACIALVEAEGGEAFFARPDWQRRLRARARDHRRARPGAGDYESEAERRAAITADLQQARTALAARLPGHTGRHLAFPWGEGSAAAVDAARESGYKACFWGRVEGRLANRAGGDPFRIARIGEDFIRALPGEGRIPLRRVVAGKLERRLRHGSPYLSH